MQHFNLSTSMFWNATAWARRRLSNTLSTPLPRRRLLYVYTLFFKRDVSLLATLRLAGLRCDGGPFFVRVLEDGGGRYSPSLLDLDNSSSCSSVRYTAIFGIARASSSCSSGREYPAAFGVAGATLGSAAIPRAAINNERMLHTLRCTVPEASLILDGRLLGRSLYRYGRAGLISHGRIRGTG